VVEALKKIKERKRIVSVSQARHVSVSFSSCNFLETFPLPPPPPPPPRLGLGAIRSLSSTKGG